MPALTFFRQARVDGGVRTGIDIDDESVWQRFEAGNEEPDPALLWYIDVRCDGEDLPGERGQARQWFLDQAPIIKPAFRVLAEKLRVGVDEWPYQFRVPGSPPAVQLRIVCSAVRGLSPDVLSNALERLGDQWERILTDLEAAEAA